MLFPRSKSSQNNESGQTCYMRTQTQSPKHSLEQERSDFHTHTPHGSLMESSVAGRVTSVTGEVTYSLRSEKVLRKETTAYSGEGGRLRGFH